MRSIELFFFSVLMLTIGQRGMAVSLESELKSLHGTMIFMISENQGIESEVWAKGNSLRSEIRVGDSKVISIQLGHIIYAYGEGSKSGTKQVVRRGLGAMGLIKQIAEIRARGKKQGTQDIEGTPHDLYHYDVNMPAESALVYFSRDTMLPRLWISVVQTDEKTAQMARMIFRDLEANVEIADTKFELPANVEFKETSLEPTQREPVTPAPQPAKKADSDIEKGLFVVIAPTTNIMSEATVLDTLHVGDVLKVSHRQGDWLYVDQKVKNGRVKARDVLALEQARDHFNRVLEDIPQEPDALLGRAKLSFWLARNFGPGLTKEELDSLLVSASLDFHQAALARPSVDAIYGRGIVRMQQKKYSQAIADFDSALEIAPGNLDVIKQRVMAWVKANQLENALEDCNLIQRLDPSDAEGHSLRCFVLGLKGEWDDAMVACDTALEVDPKLASAYLRRGTIWAGKGDDIHAKADYDVAILLGEDIARAFRARILYQQGELQKTIDDMNVLIELNPMNPEFWFQRGSTLLNLKNWDRGIADLTKAIELNPTAEAFRNRGIALSLKNEFTRALADFVEAIKLAPNDPLIYQHRARIYVQLQRHKEAVADLTKYLELVSDDLPARVQLGMSRYFSGDFINALKDLDIAIEREPNDPGLFLIRGSIWNAMMDHQRAIVDFTRNIELDPQSFEGYSYRGAARSMSGDKEKAIADYNEAIRLNPEFEVAYINRGSHWLSNAEYDKALLDFRKALRLKPDRASVLNEIAAILATATDARVRNGKEAVELATRACVLSNHKNGEYLSTLAAAYAEYGDYESAVQWQTKSLKLASDDAKKNAQLKLDLFRSGQPYRLTRNP